MSKPAMIDLFAGAGGLSLGLVAAGFESLLAVELSPMAAETYYRNFLEDDPEAWAAHVNLTPEGQIAAGLAVQSARSVLERIDAVRRLVPDDGELDLIAGGPPCQGFSVAGLRNPADQRNQLPFEFLEFVGALSPKFVLIENVAGIGMSFVRTPGQAPLEQLRDALELTGPLGYVSQILEMNAADFGVAQQRPRIMIAGIRRDLAREFSPGSTDDELQMILASEKWSSGELRWNPPLLAPVEAVERTRIAVDEVLGDLNSDGYVFETRGEYAHMRPAESLRYSDLCLPPTARTGGHSRPPNHVLRRHGSRVTLRFRLHLALAQYGVSGDVFRLGIKHQHDPRGALASVAQVLEQHGVPSPLRMPDGSVLIDPDSLEDVGSTQRSLRNAILELATKKHSQRALRVGHPSPTVLSLPDDFIHYREPRTLTVREMARIQSFPDSFVFHGKETTGADRRRFEVPQYTQVGNAVPPMMARAVGMHLSGLIEFLSSQHSRPGVREPALAQQVMQPATAI